MAQNYFAAANSGMGFVSWFDNIFDPEKIDRTYIIKGGSGTGKSTIMRRLAKRLSECGAELEYFYCSSDADSLDGIIASRSDGTRLAMIDGTAPHMRDPRYPGAAEEIINVGDFWDSEKLRLERAEIINLGKRKAACFSEAYGCFASAAELQKRLREETESCVLKEKLRAAAERLLTKRMKEKHVRPGGESVCRIRALSALATQGSVHFDSYSENCEAIALAVDAADSVSFLYDALIDAARTLGLDYDRAPSPLEPELTEGLYFPELSFAVVNRTGKRESEYRILNMARFIDHDRHSYLDRARRRILRKTAHELVNGGLDRLAEVRVLHGELERIYISAMDFERMNAAMESLIGSAVDFMGENN